MWEKTACSRVQSRKANRCPQTLLRPLAGSWNANTGGWCQCRRPCPYRSGWAALAQQPFHGGRYFSSCLEFILISISTGAVSCEIGRVNKEGEAERERGGVPKTPGCPVGAPLLGPTLPILWDPLGFQGLLGTRPPRPPPSNQGAGSWKLLRPGRRISTPPLGELSQEGWGWQDPPGFSCGGHTPPLLLRLCHHAPGVILSPSAYYYYASW